MAELLRSAWLLPFHVGLCNYMLYYILPWEGLSHLLFMYSTAPGNFWTVSFSRCFWELTFSCASFSISSPIFSFATSWSTGDHLDDAPDRVQPKRRVFVLNRQSEAGRKYWQCHCWELLFSMFCRKCCSMNDFMKVLHVVTLLESILLLFAKGGISVGAEIQDTACGSHSTRSLSFQRI